MPVIAKTLKDVASWRKEPLLQEQDTQDSEVPLMCSTGYLVQYFSNDPHAVDAEWIDGRAVGSQLRALCVLPCELEVALADNHNAGTLITVQGPIGPIQLESPPDAKPGMMLHYRLAPKPDARVKVPAGVKPGSAVAFRRADGVSVSAVVPEGHGPGDSFDITPPALMVRVPQDAKKGDWLAFHGPRAPGMPTEWFQALVPEGLKPGEFMTARLPMPPLWSHVPQPEQSWMDPWAACAAPAAETEAACALVEFLVGDPFAVNARHVDGEPVGRGLRAEATFPIELTATLGENYEHGKPVVVQSPIGPVQILPPADLKPGMTLHYRMAPRPDMRVRVPRGKRPGSRVTVKRPDGLEIGLTVPEGSRPGDFFEAAPPAVMVRAPEGAEAGDFVILGVRTGPNRRTMHFEAQVPAGIEPGKIFTARMPAPRLPPSDISANDDWGFDGLWRAITEAGA